MTDVVLRRFQPLHLKLEKVGPFRGPFEMALTGPGEQPANFFLLVSKNGFGKTTILETIYSLMGALDSGDFDYHPPPPHPDLLKDGKAQLDIRIELESSGKTTTVVLSLIIDSEFERPLRTVTPSLLEEAQAETWLPVQVSSSGVHLGINEFSLLNLEIREIVGPICKAIAEGNDLSRRFTPNGDSLLLPTALYFPADRRILSPGDGPRAITQPDLAYRSAHRFLTDGETWETSLDGLLVWYEWLGGGLFEQTRDLVNTLLFGEAKNADSAPRYPRKRLVDIDRHRLGAVIEVEHEDGSTYRHGLDRLSHGERSLMHLLVRSAYHRSGSTILMIDEMETHLHPRWQHQVMTMLKEWIRQWPDLTVIATTHQPEMMEAFAFERPEDGLVKGGYLIEANEL